MKLKLTHRQWQAARWAGTDRHRLYFDRAEALGKQREVDMPPAAWRALARRLEDEAFTRWGKARNLAHTEGAGARSTLAAIWRQLARLEVHPAMRNEIVVGVSVEEFFVWRHGDDWTPYPSSVPDQPYTLLPRYEASQIVSVDGRRLRLPEGFTWWTAEPCWTDWSEHIGWSLDEDQAAGAGEDEVRLNHHAQ